MKYDFLIPVLELSFPIVVLAQSTVTVRLNTGSCAAPYITESPSFNGSGSGGTGPGGVSSGSQGLTVLTSTSNAINATSTDLSSSSANPLLSTSTQSSITTNITSSVVTPGSTAATSSPASPSASVNLSGFLLRYAEHTSVITQHFHHRRQQSTIFSGYVLASGQTTVVCANSMVYSLSDSGTLSSGGGTVFSTSPGTVYQRFNASSNIQSIYAAWQVSNQTSVWSNNLYKTLVWNNDLFSNNTAAFCVIHGVLRVYFLFPHLPDCMPVNLAILPLSACKNRHILPSPSATAVPFMRESSNDPIISPLNIT